MLLGGLWHGAGWTFVVWGGLHGVYLVVNHAWHGLRQRRRYPMGKPPGAGRIAGKALTFFAVVVAWVFFRASNLDAALAMVRACSASTDIRLPGGLYGLFHWRVAQAMDRSDSLRGLADDSENTPLMPGSSRCGP